MYILDFFNLYIINNQLNYRIAYPYTLKKDLEKDNKIVKLRLLKLSSNKSFQKQTTFENARHTVFTSNFVMSQFFFYSENIKIKFCHL